MIYLIQFLGYINNYKMNAVATSSMIKNLEGFKGEKVLTYLGILLSLATVTLLFKQYYENKSHLAIQKQLALKQLDKLNAEG